MPRKLGGRFRNVLLRCVVLRCMVVRTSVCYVVPGVWRVEQPNLVVGGMGDLIGCSPVAMCIVAWAR